MRRRYEKGPLLSFCVDLEVSKTDQKKGRRRYRSNSLAIGGLRAQGITTEKGLQPLGKGSGKNSNEASQGGVLGGEKKCHINHTSFTVAT